MLAPLFVVGLMSAIISPSDFAKLDTNGDSRISADELRAWFGTRFPSYVVDQLIADVLTNDTNGDGFLDISEISHVADPHRSINSPSRPTLQPAAGTFSTMADKLRHRAPKCTRTRHAPPIGIEPDEGNGIGTGPIYIVDGKIRGACPYEKPELPRGIWFRPRTNPNDPFHEINREDRPNNCYTKIKDPHFKRPHRKNPQVINLGINDRNNVVESCDVYMTGAGREADSIRHHKRGLSRQSPKPIDETLMAKPKPVEVLQASNYSGARSRSWIGRETRRTDPCRLSGYGRRSNFSNCQPNSSSIDRTKPVQFRGQDITSHSNSVPQFPGRFRSFNHQGEPPKKPTDETYTHATAYNGVIPLHPHHPYDQPTTRRRYRYAPTPGVRSVWLTFSTPESTEKPTQGFADKFKTSFNNAVDKVDEKAIKPTRGFFGRVSDGFGNIKRGFREPFVSSND